MEEYIVPLLWLLFIGATTLVPALIKARKEAQAKREKEQEESQIPDDQYSERVFPVQMPTSTLGSTIASSIQESDFSSGIAYQEPDPIHAEAHTADTPESQEIADFDLRKAVIYSEILKPKFDE